MTSLPVGEDAVQDLLPAVHYPGNGMLIPSERFLALKKKSADIVGWLRFDQVDEPVVFRDNTFFLTHDATGKKNSNGAIFLDAGISPRTRPYTVILYGHNMKSGNMFGRLKKYRESAFFYQNRFITFDSMYEDGEYAVFAVLDMNTVPGTARWFNLWSLMTDSRRERTEAIETLKKHAAVSGVLDVRADDQLLLLVTCLDGEDERLVVAARRLREGETRTHLEMPQ